MAFKITHVATELCFYVCLVCWTTCHFSYLVMSSSAPPARPRTCRTWPPWSWAAARWTAPHWSGGLWAAACWAGSRWKTGWSPAATHWSRRCGPTCWARCHERLRSCSRHPPDELWTDRQWSIKSIHVGTIGRTVFGAESIFSYGCISSAQTGACRRFCKSTVWSRRSFELL